MRSTHIVTGLAIATLTVAGGGLALATTGPAMAAPPRARLGRAPPPCRPRHCRTRRRPTC
ncbi:hypothetical protein [Raineyella fluvialis]|uniref:Uncharacterized protein n=1 Tax=Raineyella fluvialis TaxID=2662261 RepID=A0A5Q2FCI6_9ACTN|nr:hypothetical protein [Raineyella fluvialis]QGF24499.1 hypothetical protein Rai3103_13515 [Raineyella fluvialis]